MRTLLLALIGVVFFSAVFWEQQRTTIPTVSADTVSVKEVRRQSDRLIVERPAGATAGSKSSVFVVSDNDGVLRRVPVQYGRVSSSSIEIVSGLSSGDQIIVSDMRAWDAFERIQLRFR